MPRATDSVGMDLVTWVIVSGRIYSCGSKARVSNLHTSASSAQGDLPLHFLIVVVAQLLNPSSSCSVRGLDCRISQPVAPRHPLAANGNFLSPIRRFS